MLQQAFLKVLSMCNDLNEAMVLILFIDKNKRPTYIGLYLTLLYITSALRLYIDSH